MTANSPKGLPTKGPGQEGPAGQLGPRWFSRASMIAIALVPLVLLAIAATLLPDADGLGTHQQLGLPPCSMRVLFGVRCPACGMTTSWSHFMRGDWIASFQSNIGGFALAATAIFFSPIAIASAVRGRWLSLRMQRALVLILLSIAAIAGVEWGIRLIS